MTNEFRNRLVGSIIVVAAGIIIIPSILDGQKTSYKDDFKPIPERPEFKSVQSSKVFPQKTFEQRLPKADAKTEEVPVDEGTQDIAATQRQAPPVTTPDSRDTTVFENDKVAVAALNKPVDFDRPIAKTTAATQSTSSAKAAAPKPTPPKTVTPKTNSAFNSSAWVIQLGVFSVKANAVSLEKKLNDAGFVTFSRQIVNNNRSMTKVYVGPELNRKILEDSMAKVTQVSGLKGTLTSYTVRNPG